MFARFVPKQLWLQQERACWRQQDWLARQVAAPAGRPPSRALAPAGFESAASFLRVYTILHTCSFMGRLMTLLFGPRIVGRVTDDGWIVSFDRR
jgi:hypothetical protein